MMMFVFCAGKSFEEVVWEPFPGVSAKVLRFVLIKARARNRMSIRKKAFSGNPSFHPC